MDAIAAQSYTIPYHGKAFRMQLLSLPLGESSLGKALQLKNMPKSRLRIVGIRFTTGRTPRIRICNKPHYQPISANKIIFKPTAKKRDLGGLLYHLMRRNHCLNCLSCSNYYYSHDPQHLSQSPPAGNGSSASRPQCPHPHLLPPLSSASSPRSPQLQPQVNPIHTKTIIATVKSQIKTPQNKFGSKFKQWLN